MYIFLGTFTFLYILLTTSSISGWLMPAVSLESFFLPLPLMPTPKFFLLLTLPVQKSHLYFLHHYLPFIFLLDLSVALGRRGKTAAHPYLAKQIFCNISFFLSKQKERFLALSLYDYV